MTKRATRVLAFGLAALGWAVMLVVISWLAGCASTNDLERESAMRAYDRAVQQGLAAPRPVERPNLRLCDGRYQNARCVEVPR